jgi:hypothetical protein
VRPLFCPETDVLDNSAKPGVPKVHPANKITRRRIT